MQFAFSPYDLWPLAILLLTIWLALLARSPRPFACGFAFGLGWFAIGAWWLAPTFHHYGHLAWPLAILGELLTGTALACLPALLGWSVVRLSSDDARALLLLFAPLTVLEEWLRGHLFTGLPWTELGNLTLDTPWIGWGGVVGGLGLSLLPPLVATGLWGLSRRELRRSASALLGSAALLALLAPATSVPETPPTRITLAQPNIAQDVKWDRRWLETTMQRLATLSANGRDSDLILWPEAATPFFLSDTPGWRAWIAAHVDRWQTPLLFGGLKRTQDDTAANGAWLLRPNRSDTAFVGKHHLVPFGEYVPAWLPWLHKMVPDIGNFRPATDSGVLTIGDALRVGVLICYESIFADEMRHRIAGGANMLAVLTNDAWYDRSPAAWQHLQAARMRAVESNRFVLRAANTGVSAIIAPDGRITATTDWWQPAIVTGIATPIATVTPYCRYGDTPLLATLLLMIAATTWRFRRQPLGSARLHPPKESP